MSKLTFALNALDEVVRQQAQKIATMTATINQQKARIAELEAELASLKDIHKAKWVESYARICANTTEEGEG